ncbi:MAG TPA: hypothetical protein VHV77_11075 [Pirellulales bacterium]|nr:hypothetical protein [Pirellulales bacterium]
MWKWIRALDSILRGEATRPSQLRDTRIAVPVGGLAFLIVVLGAFYGFCMGWFALFNRESPEYVQVLASMIKVPALFILTVLVTLPSLYVFNALAGSRLNALAILQLIVSALAVTLAVLASFGPIVAFYSLTTTSYPFMLILNVFLFIVAGTLGLSFLLQTMHRLTLRELAIPSAVPGPDAGTNAPPTPAEPASALARVPAQAPAKNVRAVFICWVIAFGLVGAQMSWVLRPFIGAPDRPFEWFRHRESNFFQTVGRTLQKLFE